MSEPETIDIDSRQAFRDAVLWALRAADARAARSLCLVDPDFAEWPLDDSELIDTLTRWLQRPQRRLVMLAAGFDGMLRQHARFTAWRPAWSHLIDPRVPGEGLAQDLPTLLFDDGPVSLQLHDAIHWRGQAGIDAAQARSRRDTIDAVLQRSESAWPVRPLGL